MCGIIGIAGTNPIADRRLLAAGRDCIRHRGPDDAGEHWSADGRVGLGFRRLSIIDLSAAGHQPMSDAGGELSIVFNGEIYNFTDLRQELVGRGHAFRSKSDTEVILAAYREWGADCLQHLNGMFAFALYDERRAELFVARDRAGEKPLFYTLTSGEFRFASELKGLMADRALPRKIDPEAMDCYLTMGFVPRDRCILQGFNKLPAAHALTFKLVSGQLRVWRYWSLPAPVAVVRADGASDRALVDELEMLLQDSVRRQLVADVPVGVLLSGGLDSSLVTAMAVRAAPKVRTFTVRLPGFGSYDETEHARLIASHFGTEHLELDAGAGDTSVDLLPMLARQVDEPIADSSIVPTYLVSRLAREQCTVALGGDGGDELFGGYRHYSRLLRMQRTFGRMPRPLRWPVAKAAARLLPVGFKGRNWLQALEANLDTGLPWIATHFDRCARRHLMPRSYGWPLVGELIRAQNMPATQDLLQRATRSDFENYLVDDILAKVDRASMLCSLEVRAPVLDYRMIEFAFAKVPSCLKATVSEHKILLKRLATRVLPKGFDLHRKQGFSIPLASWLRAGPWREFFRSVLLESDGTIFDKRALRELLTGQDRGRANAERLFALVMFELWRRAYRVGA
jgi:asparagine synthase (glutamine-hydrolysing)